MSWSNFHQADGKCIDVTSVLLGSRFRNSMVSNATIHRMITNFNNDYRR